MMMYGDAHYFVFTIEVVVIIVMIYSSLFLNIDI